MEVNQPSRMLLLSESLKQMSQCTSKTQEEEETGGNAIATVMVIGSHGEV